MADVFREGHNRRLRSRVSKYLVRDRKNIPSTWSYSKMSKVALSSQVGSARP